MPKMPKNTETKPEQKQSPTIKVPPDLKTEIESMRQENETAADVIRRLMATKAAKEILDDDAIVLRMNGRTFRTILMALNPIPHLADSLLKARVME